MPTILVTGANRGVGLALATAYAARGDSVIATTRDPARTAALNAIGSGNVRVSPLDVTDADSIDRLAQSLAGEAIDTVICNSGVMGSRGGLASPGYGADEWARVFATNVTGVFLVARALLPHLLKAKAGKIAIISSMMGSSSQAGGDCYSYRATKAAAANLGLNLSVELEPRGIAVGIYHPGWVQTDMGGPSAAITPAESARGLIARVDALSIATTGVFEDHSGQKYAF